MYIDLFLYKFCWFAVNVHEIEELKEIGEFILEPDQIQI
jgi:hypothetical protein